MTIKKYAGDKITGLSSDTKPTNVPEGGTFYELDTGKVYRLYSSTWSEIDNTKANLAFDKANNALPNTSGVSFDGNLVFPTGNVDITAGRLYVVSPANNTPFGAYGAGAAITWDFNGTSQSFLDSNTIYFRSGYPDQTERMRIDPSGNVIVRGSDSGVRLGFGTWDSDAYIGTTTSDAMFFRTSNTNRIRIGSSGYTSFYGITEVESTGSSADFYVTSVGGSGRSWLMSSGTNGNWNFYDSTGSNNRFIITPGGNALFYTANGVMTHQLDYSNQGGRLTIRDDTGTSATRLEEQINATRLLQLIDGSNMYIGFGSSTVANGNIMFMRPGYNEAVRIEQTGNLLINRTDSTVGQNVKLDVNGAINASAVLVNGVPVSGSGGVAVATLDGANTAIGAGANAYAELVGDGGNAYTDFAVSGAYSYADSVGTGANTFLIATIAGANTAVGTAANAFASATIAGANTAVGAGANNYLRAIIAGANTAVGTAANAFSAATIAGANTEVGSGANSYASATIAGANTAVGAGANAYMIAVQNGSNTAIGAGANAFSAATISGSNSFFTATIAGANTAVGTGANNYLRAIIAGANTAVGTAANNFASATIAGANAISSSAFSRANSANDIAVSAFVKANAALPNTSGVTFNGDLTISSTLRANVVNSLAGFIDLGPGSRPAYAEGRIYYDNVDKSLTVHNDTTFTYPIGQIEYARVWNDSGSTLPKGAPVYATGYHMTNHHHFTVDLADASDPAKYDVIGLVAADIPTANHGYVIVRGWIGGINTASLTAGSRYHLGFAAPGTLVTTAPEYPNFPYDIGYCTVSDATNGYLYIDRQTHTFESLRVTGAGRISGDFVVEGDFTVLGAENNITVNSLQVGTQFIYLGAGDSISNANVYFTGSGLDDLEFRGHYEGAGTTNFYVMISDVNPDKFSWSYLSNFTVLEQQNVAIQFQTTQLLSNGISVYFNSNTGHTIGNKWNATATGVSTDFGFVGNHIDGPNGYTHAGLFRDATDGAFKFFNTYDPEVEGVINIGDATYTLANIEVLKVTAGQVYEGTMRLTDSMSVNAIATTAAFLQANTARTAANNAYDKANSANVLAFNTGIGANAFAAATVAGANSFAVATFGAANNTPVGNTLSSSFTTRSTRRTLNFIPGSNITINVDDDSAGDRSNITITSTASGGGGGNSVPIPLVADAVDATRYIVFANNLTGNLVTANVDAGFTFNPSSNTLTINGALNAITKSFVIEHPVREGMMLRYGSLEGPENGVYVRGKLEGKSIIELPDYWWNLIDEDTITVNLTPYGRPQELWVQSTSSHFIHLNQPADCYFTVFAERKDVEKLIVEY